MPWRLPVGIDKADGVTPLPLQPRGSGGGYAPVGVPDPAGDVDTYSNNDDLDPNGNACTIAQPPDYLPEIERAEQATFSNMTKMAWRSAVAFIGLIGRGTFVQDSFGNIWRILSAKLKGERGGMGTLTLVGESISFDSPPDDYQMTPSELGLDIIKYPRYFYALYPSGSDFTDLVGIAPAQATRAQVKQAIIRAIQTYRDSPYFPSQGQVTINGVVQNSIVNYFISSLIPTILPPSSVKVPTKEA